MKCILVFSLMLLLFSCNSQHLRCVGDKVVVEHRICLEKRTKEVKEVELYDEKFIRDDLLLIFAIFLKSYYKVNYNKENIKIKLYALNDTTILRNFEDNEISKLCSLYDDNLKFKSIVNLLLDKADRNSIINLDVNLYNNNKQKGYYSSQNEILNFVSFVIACFNDSEGLDVQDLRNNLLLTILANVRHNEMNNSIVDLKVSRSIFEIVDPEYDIDGLIVKLKLDIEKGQLK